MGRGKCGKGSTRFTTKRARQARTRLGRVIQEGKMTNKETRKTQQGKYGKEASKWEKKDNKNKTKFETGRKLNN